MGKKNWKEVDGLADRDIFLVEVEHVKAHHTKKDKKICRSLRGLSPGELAQEGAMLDEGCKSRNYAEGEREEVYATLQKAASFHCLVERWKDCEELKPNQKETWIFVVQKREETKHRTEWCAEADRYRCMRCGRRSK